MHDLKVWVGVEADGSGLSTTPGKTSGQLDEMSRVAKAGCYTLDIIRLSTNYYMKNMYLSIHRVSKKTVQNCFRQNFVKFPPILIILGRKMAKRLKLCELHSFATSPNSPHHTSMLDADFPNSYTML